MGSGGEASGFMGSKWMTIILIAVLVILAVALYFILGDNEKADRFFKRFQRNKQKQGKPLKPKLSDQPHNSSYQFALESIDDRLKVVARLSWQKPVSPSQI